MAYVLSSEPLLTEKTLQTRVVALAREINAYYGEEEPYLVLGILNGVFVFLADLLRHLHGPVEVAFVGAESYGDRTESQGQVQFRGLDKLDCRGKKVLLVDDIVDSGHTLSQLVARLEDIGAAEVRSCTLLDKPSRRKVPFGVHYRGFVIEDHFVVGYGLDYAGRYRQLPAVYRLVNEA